MKNKNLFNVYFFMALVILLIALLGNFLTKGYFVFLGVFIVTNYMKIFLLSLLFAIIILSASVLVYKLNSIDSFIKKDCRLYRRFTFISINLILWAIIINSTLNMGLSYMVKYDLMILLPKIYNIATIGANDIFYGYMVNNALLILTAGLIMININKKR